MVSGVFPLFGLWNIVWSKSVSLAVLSTVSADLIVLSAMRTGVNLVLLSFSVFLGAVVFNLMGLMAASFARSVNHYMIIVLLPAVCCQCRRSSQRLESRIRS